MDNKRFCRYQRSFIEAMRKVLGEYEDREQLRESAFNAYTEMNFLARHLFWARLRKTINFLESSGPYESVLDFGCGSGVMLPLLSSFSKRVVGVDIDLCPYRAVSKYFEFTDNIETHEIKSGLSGCFSDHSFDVITALDVLEHVDDLKSVFEQFCRLGKKKGLVVVSGPTENFFYKIGRKISGKEYTGHYHKRNIYDVNKVMKQFMRTKTVFTLYYPVPLFKIYAGILGD
jgi:2-polyprenyl-3-methyl-5-hydroxy-6-metoxy-1,4-benzoquinol methylase